MCEQENEFGFKYFGRKRECLKRIIREISATACMTINMYSIVSYFTLKFVLFLI